jgi:hypothetical protein
MPSESVFHIEWARFTDNQGIGRSSGEGIPYHVSTPTPLELRIGGIMHEVDTFLHICFASG